MASPNEVSATLVMPAALRVLIIAVTGAVALLLAAALLTFSIKPELGGGAGLAFWVAVTLLASALPVRFPRGNLISVSTAPILASMILGGPAAAGIVALLGTTEWREVRGRIPWYGTVFNHAVLTGPAIIGGVGYDWLVRTGPSLAPAASVE